MPWRYYPGFSDFPDLHGTIQYHWLVHHEGLFDAVASQYIMFPAEINRWVLDGFPLDAIASFPWLLVFGWPTGFTLFQIAALWAVGLAMLWMGRTWFPNTPTVLVGAIAYQSAACIIREMAYGRPTQVFGAIFFPLAWGMAHRALTEAKHRDAILSGVFLGLSALSYWFHGIFCGIGILLLFFFGSNLSALVSRPRDPSMVPKPVFSRIWAQIPLRLQGLALISVGCSVVVMGPLIHTIMNLEQQPGVELNLWSTVIHSGQEIELSFLLTERSALATWHAESSFIPSPLLIVLIALAVVAQPVRTWLAPLAVMSMGFVFSLGPVIPFLGIDILAPFSLISVTPGLQRLWWPDRALFLAAPAMALLVIAGAQSVHQVLLYRLRMSPSPQRLTYAICIGLLMEAFLFSNNLPMPTTNGEPSAVAQELAERDGPLLVLPTASSRMRRGATMLIDQVTHERPLLNGPMPPSGETAPTHYKETFEVDGLAHLLLCESETDQTVFTEDAPVAREALIALGIDEIIVEEAPLQAYVQYEIQLKEAQNAPNVPTSDGLRRNYLHCIESLLGEPSGSTESIRRYQL